ncbi:MAG: hypothetical protein PHE67_00980 [Campylobacterales bacterium]|nr:hypothetical protein [Campylobacterales bacterium]
MRTQKNKYILKTKNIAYYSGTTAINLYSSKNTGDWHAVETIKAINSGNSKSPYFLVGNKREVNTIPYLGMHGIINCESILKGMGADPKQKYKLAANHYRAVADMVLWSALNNKSLDFIAINDWMVKKTDRQKVYSLLKTSYKKLGINTARIIKIWIKKAEESN